MDKVFIIFLVLVTMFGLAYWITSERNCDGTLVRTATGTFHCIGEK